ncbi:MAG: pilus assembly protein [Chloroflexi bacterium]|nr:pilus assembly protein [Chloroflexota bacterium]MBU1751788.1 pilus assembly protein [Chloroflexota bacterium]
MNNGERGQAAIEVLFAILIVGLLIFGALEFGRAYAIRHSLDAGGWRAARYLSLYPDDLSTAVQLVRDEVMQNLGADLAAQVTVTVTPDPAGLGFQEAFTVHAECPWAPLTPIPLLIVTNKTLAVEHTLTVERYP